MDLSKLTYSKSDSTRTLGAPIPNSTIERMDDFKIPKVNIAPDYQKKDGTLSTNLVFVFSGGEKREKDFLRELILQRELHSLRIAFMSKKGQGLHPNQMQKKWEEIQSVGEFNIEGQIYHLDTMDKVFLLSDVDEFYEQLVEILRNKNKEHQGQWIISNPCFEIWLYYCFKNDPNTDLACLEPLTINKRSKKLKHIGDDIVKGGLSPLLAFEKMEEGIKHSLKHYAEDKNSIPVLYATQMHKMAKYLVDTINNNANEYSEFVKRKAEWRNLMRQKRVL